MLSFREAYHDVRKSVIDARHRYSVLTFETNLGKVLRKNRTALVLIAISFILAIVALLAIAYIRTNILMARLIKFTASASNNTLSIENMDKNTTYSNLTALKSFDLCYLFSHKFFDDFSIVIISLVLTGIIYAWNIIRSCNSRTAKCQPRRRLDKTIHSSSKRPIYSKQNSESESSNSFSSDEEGEKNLQISIPIETSNQTESKWVNNNESLKLV